MPSGRLGAEIYTYGRLGPWLVLVGMALSGCGSQPGADESCVVTPDCLPGYVCLGSTCVPQVPRSTDGPGPPPPCQPMTCDAAEATCGSVSDGCGGTLDCGTCGHPDTCGGGGVANRCGCTSLRCGDPGATCGRLDDGCGGVVDCGPCEDEACIPADCETLDAVCNTIGDGCGGTLSCGSCASGRYCQGNQCMCDPKTCEQLGAACGLVDDGCGHPIDCGDPCEAPYTCGGGDQANQCGCALAMQPPTALTTFGRAQSVSAGGGTVAWQQLTAAQVGKERQGARFTGRNGTKSQYLFLSGVDLAIPPGAIVRGIEVVVDIARGLQNPYTPILEDLRVVGPHTTSGNLAKTIALPTANVYFPFEFGGPTDLAGATWTPETLNSPDFGVRIQFAATGSGNVYVDYAQVRVHYEACE